MAVCCIDEAGAWGASLAASGVPVTALERRPGFRPSLGARIAAVAARHGADVIHCHQVLALRLRLHRALRPARLLFTEHGRLADAPPSRSATANQALRLLPDRVFTVSDDLQRHLVREGFSPIAVEVIYNGMDPDAAPGDAARVRGETLAGPARRMPSWSATVGRLDPVKDSGRSFAAFARVVATGRRPGGAAGHRRRPRAAGPRARCGRVRLSRIASASLGHRDDVRPCWPASTCSRTARCSKVCR